MKKVLSIFKNLFLLLALVVVTNCTGGKKVLCDTGKVAASVVAIGISTELACTNTAAITTTLQEKLEATSICEEPAAKSLSPIGAIICAPLIEGVFAGGISQLPKEWGCTGTGSIVELKAKLIASCQKAI